VIRGARTALRVAWLIGLGGAALAQVAPRGGIERGGRIYGGAVALAAHLRGHEEALPGGASRCVNCHAGADTSAARFAPALTSSFLRTPRARRGGPASAYDLASFCRVLRSGIDPMQIVLPQAMPRFELSDADCAALWAFLTRDEEPAS
jgi:hypothetical protein